MEDFVRVSHLAAPIYAPSVNSRSTIQVRHSQMSLERNYLTGYLVSLFAYNSG